jgi:hypothetical protein
MKTIKEYAEDAAARLRRSPSGSTQPKNGKSKLPKPQGNVPKVSTKPTGRGK